jgi:hypothetical protein
MLKARSSSVSGTRSTYLWSDKMAGLLGREHQGRVCRFVKILAKGSPKDY